MRTAWCLRQSGHQRDLSDASRTRAGAKNAIAIALESTSTDQKASAQRQSP